MCVWSREDGQSPTNKPFCFTTPPVPLPISVPASGLQVSRALAAASVLQVSRALIAPILACWVLLGWLTRTEAYVSVALKLTFLLTSFLRCS